MRNRRPPGPVPALPSGQKGRTTSPGDIPMPRPTSSAPKPRCAELASVFQSPLLEEPMRSDATVSDAPAVPGARRPGRAGLPRLSAARAAASTPAVVEHDVAGLCRRHHAGRAVPDPPRTPGHRGPGGLRHPGRGHRRPPAGRPRRGRSAPARPPGREPGNPGPPPRLLAVHGEAAPAAPAAHPDRTPGRAVEPSVSAVLAAAATVDQLAADATWRPSVRERTSGRRNFWPSRRRLRRGALVTGSSSVLPGRDPARCGSRDR